MEIYYYTKPDKKKWSGDDYGALEKAQALAIYSEPETLNNSLIESNDKGIRGKIVVKGTNIEDLLHHIKKHPNQFNLDKLTFIVGGNQTEKTLEFISEIRELNQNCKIEADIMPGTIDEELEQKHTGKNTRINISYDAITGTTPKNVHKNLFEKNQTRELSSLEQKWAKNESHKFVTVHWGGAIAGEGISDKEQELHKQELLNKLQLIRKENSKLQILFVPHGRRSFLPQENSSTTQENRKKDFINTLSTEFGDTNLHTNLNYHVALEFTRQHQKDCAGIITTAENLSTIAEQLSILEPKEGQKPPVHILLFPCCKFNNDIWKGSTENQLKEAWLSNVKSIELHDFEIALKITNSEEKPPELGNMTIARNQGIQSQTDPNIRLRQNKSNRRQQFSFKNTL